MRITVSDVVSPSYFPLTAAVELGFFKAEGLQHYEPMNSVPNCSLISANRFGSKPPCTSISYTARK